MTPPVTLVTSEEYPSVVEALNCVNGDSGSPHVPVHEIPKRWEEYLPQLEESLKSLSRTERAPESSPLPPHVKPSEFLDSEFYTFCNGEYSEMSAITNRDLNMTRANVFLYDFFEGWTYTQDSGAETPRNVTLRRRIEWLDEIEKESSVGLSSEQEQERHQLRMSIL